MLSAGDAAPDFTLLSDEGKPVHLGDLRGKNVVLYFYPKDDTPGCTREACAFRDDFSGYGRLNAVILGVSLDGLQSHRKFKAKYGLPFALLSDEDAKISRAYGVYRRKSFYGRAFWGIERTTFVIGPEGKIQAVFPKVKVEGHSEEIMRAVRGKG